MLMQRLEIYWSRILLLNQGEEATLIQTIETVDEKVASLVSGLEAIEGMLLALAPGDMAGLEAIRDLLNAQVACLRDMNLELFARKSPAALQATLNDNHRANQTYVAGLTVIGVALLLLLFVELKRTRKFAALADAARTETDASRRQVVDAIESLSDGFALYDAQDRLVLFNETYRDMCPANRDLITAGVSFETLTANAFKSGFFVLFGQSGDEALEARIKQYRNTNGKIVQHLTDGRVIESCEFRTSEGGVASIQTDITQRTQYESALKSLVEKNRQLSAAIVATGIGVAIADARKVGLPIVFANQAFLDRTDRKAGSSATLDLTEVVAAWAARQCDGIPIQELRGLLARGTGCTREIALANDDGTQFWAALTINPIFDEGRQAQSWVLMLADITDRKMAEEAQNRLRDQLFQAQKMEAIGTLAGGIAHDFNNILAAILGNSELASQDIPSGHPARESIDEIKLSSRRAADLVAQIMSFARPADGQAVGPVHLDQVAEECRRMLRAAIPTTIALDVDNRSALPVVSADPSQMQQVLMNLCVNASHAIGSTHGRVAIRIEDWPGHETDESIAGPLAPGWQRLQFGSPMAGDKIVLVVEDTGCGMDPDTMVRAFDPFFTTKPDGQGTGLGLPMVLGVVLKLGGAITVDSALALGTRLRLALPATDRRVDSAAPVEQESIRGRGNILVVDDEAAIASVARRLLERLGYDVTAASSGREALRLYRAKPTSWNAIVTDQTMPNMTGLELAAEIAKSHYAPPIILTTGRRDAVDQALLDESGIAQVVAKPWTAVTLAKALHNALIGEDDDPKSQRAQRS